MRRMVSQVSVAPSAVIPAKAGIQRESSRAARTETPHWIPAFAGMTEHAGMTQPAAALSPNGVYGVSLPVRSTPSAAGSLTL
jgi:hypothetical protein